jgi:hypothetical protein
MPMPGWWDDDDDDYDDYGEYDPRWGRRGVYFRDGQWRCPCARYTSQGICHHLVPFRKTVNVEVKDGML